MNLRAFVTDVDGTITDGYPLIDLEAASVLRNLEKMGYRVILASGRSIYELYSLSMFLGLCKVAVGENGAVVVEGSASEIRTLADNVNPLRAREYLEKNLGSIKPKPTLPRFSEVVLERVPDVAQVRASLAASGLPVKVLDSGYAYHVVNEHVEKALGVREVLKRLGIAMEETVALGDSETDVSLFEHCGFGIAMGNSDDAARKAAGHVTKASQGQGLVEAVSYVFKELKQ